MAGKFEIYKDNAGEFRFRLKASNGENILASEGYKSRSSAVNGIASVKTNAPVQEHYEVKENAAGRFYFVLKAGNHEVIGTSQSYASKDGAEKGCTAVMNAAPDAEVVDSES